MIDVDVRVVLFTYSGLVPSGRPLPSGWLYIARELSETTKHGENGGVLHTILVEDVIRAI